jgi:hypothetical protein
VEILFNISSKQTEIKRRKGPINPSATKPSDEINEMTIGLMLGELYAEIFKQTMAIPDYVYMCLL